MKNFISNRRGVLATLALLLLGLFPMPATAQNVTIGPRTGKLIAALTDGAEWGFENGFNSLWRHDQLPLSLITSDDGALTAAGIPATHACNLKYYNGKMINVCMKRSSFNVITLPKGFRFTGYKIVMKNNLEGVTLGSYTIKHAGPEWKMSEMGSDFTTVKKQVNFGTGDTGDREFVLERRADDMGNLLYFRLDGNFTSTDFAGISFESIEITFTSEGAFTVPVMPSAASTEGVSWVEVPFKTSKFDLGTIKPRSKGSTTYYSYDYESVKDLEAYVALYEEACVADGNYGKAVGNKGITAIVTPADAYYRLKPGTYYVESPTSVKDGHAVELPLGYRITKAVIHYRAADANGYTLKVYGRDGKTVEHAVNVASGGAEGTVELTDLNNDAVKFAVEAPPSASVNAGIRLELTMEHLNPYVESMDVVCNGPDGASLRRQSTTDDFMIGGGKFSFFVPDAFAHFNCLLTFENLRSKYADNTYYGNAGSQSLSRYSFVRSVYYDKTVTGGLDDLYGKKDIVENNPYEEKVRVEVSGTGAFRFNNADELANTNISAGDNSLKEFPFSLNAYAAAGATFASVSINPSGADHERTCYVFTADETRYNIAPTTATQHRYYAFYTMTVDLVQKEYTPVVGLRKIYDHTLFHDLATGTEDVDKPMYGVDLSTSDGGVATEGYLTARQIRDALSALTDGGTAVAPSQLLYVNAGALSTLIYESATATEPDGLGRLKAMLAPNALVYLPKNVTSDKDNFAYKLGSGTFKACKNIVITDRQPFFAPFDIQVDQANYAIYERQITVAPNGQVTSATLMLPFTLDVDNGLHTNAGGKCAFKLNVMQPANCLSLPQPETSSSSDYRANAHFLPVSGTATEANRPYMVEVTHFEEEAVTAGKLSFVATQYGSDIVATPVLAAPYVHEGETATGTIAGTSYRFLNNATYSGIKLDKTANIFYFARNMYLSTKNLWSEHLYSYPFRSYFTYKVAGSGAKALQALDVVYGENTGGITGIADTELTPDMAVTAGKGFITVTVTTNTEVKVANAAGMSVGTLRLKAGESRTLYVSAGIYLVNHVKIIVK